MDVLLMILVTRLVARRARAKGHGSLWSAPAALGYVLGQVAGFAAGAALELGLVAYVLAFAGGILTSLIGFLIVALLPHRLPLDEMAETLR